MIHEEKRDFDRILGILSLAEGTDESKQFWEIFAAGRTAKCLQKCVLNVFLILPHDRMGLWDVKKRIGPRFLRICSSKLAQPPAQFPLAMHRAALSVFGSRVIRDLEKNRAQLNLQR